MSRAESTTPVSQAKPGLDSLVEAVVAAGALVARADGRVHPVERLEMLVYMRRSGLPSPRRLDVLEVFDRLVQEIEHDRPHGVRAVENRLRSIAGSPWAWIALRAAEHVAAADTRIEEVELAAICSVRETLGLPAGVPERFPACVVWGSPA